MTDNRAEAGAIARKVRSDLIAQGDRELSAQLLAQADVRRAIEHIDKHADKFAARRHLLATSTRLTPEMAPDLFGIIDGCRATLGVDGPLELFVYPSSAFNAAAVKPEKGRLLFMVSSGLLEAFDDDELRFVIGHEVGHYLFEHHAIPSAMLLRNSGISADLALQLFAWQRFAEISSDRAGLVCAGALEPAAYALFKLASGLTGGRIQIRIDQFMAQVGDLQAESNEPVEADAAPRSDWFATHPFSPLRLKAAELFAASEQMQAGGRSLAEVEGQVNELMTIMDPSYLQAKTEVAEAMRRLLFASGVAIASVSGEVSDAAIKALGRLLGTGSLPMQIKPEVIKAELPERIKAVRDRVPPLRRVQVLRDLCVIARADGYVSDAEAQVLLDIARAIDVDPELVSCVADVAGEECATCSVGL